MVGKISQRELVVRYLAARLGEWTPSFALVKQDTEWGFLGLQSDRRAFELAEDGHFDSPHHRYFIEHRKVGKYAEFRVSRKEKHTYVQGMRDWTYGEPTYA